MQVSDTFSNTGIDLSTVEPEFSYLQHLRPSRQRPEHWNNLGSPNSRSTVQEEEVRTVIEGIMMMEAGNDVIYGFTDGSCRGNPGPCGASYQIKKELMLNSRTPKQHLECCKCILKFFTCCKCILKFLLQMHSQILHVGFTVDLFLGANCSLELRWHNNSHHCRALSSFLSNC